MGFFGSLFGGDQKKELAKSKKKSDAALQEGFDTANQRYDQAFEMFTPFAQQGIEANDRYNALLGLSTPEARAAAQETYFSDPAFSAILDQESNRLLKQQNARGQTYSGNTRVLGGRLGLENYNNYLNRLQGQGQQGLQVAGNQSAIRAGQGDLAFGYGATKAGSEINYGNARAQASQSGINNLLNLGGTIAKGVAAFSDIRLKKDIAHDGHLPSGLPIYTFRYAGDNQVYRGVMAHEARQIFPDAVSEHESGYLMVDYGKIN